MMDGTALAGGSNRPKLRTRRAISYHEEDPREEQEEDKEQDEEVEMELEFDDGSSDTNTNGTAPSSSPSSSLRSTPQPNGAVANSKRMRATRKLRARPKTSDDDDDDDDFEMQAEDEHDDSDAAADDDEDPMTESSDDAKKPRRRRRAAAPKRMPSSSSSSSRQSSSHSRKRKDAAATGNKSRRNRRLVASSSSEEDEDSEDSPTSSSTNDMETEEDVATTSSSISPSDSEKSSTGKSSGRKKRGRDESARRKLQQPQEDSEDEILFRVDKILAREVLSLNEWTKRCAKMTTRFIQSGSIFLEDDEDDDVEEVPPQQQQQQQQNQKPTGDGKADQHAVDLTTLPDNDPMEPSDEKDGESDKQDADKNQPPTPSSNATTTTTTNAAVAAATDRIDLTVSRDSQEQAAIEDSSSANENDAGKTHPPAEPTPPKPKPYLVKDMNQKEERFLIKWQKLSYIHVSWETEKALVEYDKNTRAKIQRFREKEAYGLLNNNLYGDEYFNPEFCDVDRILTIQDKPGDQFCLADDPDESQEKKHAFFLVKWKALPYDAITWERDDDVCDDAAVKQFHERIEHTILRQKAMKPAKSSLGKFRPYSTTNPPATRTDQPLELRDYQLTGVNWMLFNWYQGRNSLLADEMGLGKTVQTVTFLNHLATVEKVQGPFLIVAPLSTLAHWQREFHSWTHLNAVVYHGSLDARKIIEQFEFYLSHKEIESSGVVDARKVLPGAKSRSKTKTKQNTNSDERVRDFYRFDVLITSYEMCSCQSFSMIARIKWSMLVVDEAHRLKNRSSKLSTFLHTHFSFRNCLLLTGTPLQNNVEELWTLLNFLDGQKFKKFDDFEQQFGELKDAEQVEKLQVELKPFLLRRMKEDVEKTLAPKEETIIEVELTVLQKQYYRAIYEQNTEFLMRGTKKSNAPSLLNIVMELRKCCNHPFLINAVEEREVKRLQESASKGADPLTLQHQINELLVTSSGKLILLDKLLPRLKENGHRVLIFSQFKIMLNILQDYLRLRGWQCERIDGNVTGNDRQAAVDRFCDPNSSAFVMLLSTRAGGVGINLTAADTVIIYDSDWNPQNDLQAQSRCHRIGQKKSVKIYRLLTSKTYEMQMFHMASMKLGLDQAVLGGIRQDALQSGGGSGGRKKTSSAQAALTKQEIDNLLKHGAYEVFKEEKDGESEAASKRFGEESIDQILSRSTKIIHDPKAQMDGDGKSKSLMSSFSKATFVSSSNPDEEVDINDPDFWSKVIGLKAVEEDKSASLEFSPLQTRRCRRKAKSYKEDGSDNESPKRKRQRLNGLMDDEYVVSVSEESDSNDDLGDFSLESDESGKKRSKSKQLPIRYMGERVVEGLQSFGYGRWEAIIQSERSLTGYSANSVKKFAQEFIFGCVRIGAAGRIVARLTRAAKMQKAKDEVPPDATANEVIDYRKVLSPETIDFIKKAAIDEFGQRYEVVRDVLEELKLEKVSLFQARETQLPIRNDRDAMARLQQIERVYLLDRVVRLRLVPSDAISYVVERMQHIEDEKRITTMIEKGQLPPATPSTASDVVAPALAADPKKADGTPAPVAEPNKASPTRPPTSASKLSIDTDKPVASVPLSDGQHAEEKPVEQKDSLVAAESGSTTSQTGSEQHREQAGVQSKKIHAAPDDKSSTEGGEAATKDKTDDSVVVSAKDSMADEAQPEKSKDVAVEDVRSSVQSAVAPNGTVDQTNAGGRSESQHASSDDSKPVVPSEEPQNGMEEPTPTAPQAAVGSVPNQINPIKTHEVKPMAVVPSDEVLKLAMKVLKRLPSTSCTIVAPWWIPIIDDISLILYVHREGWLKGRKITQKLIDSPLFGKRALKHDTQSWPTISVLHARLRAVVSVWGDWKKMAQYEAMIAASEAPPKVRTPVPMPMPGPMPVPVAAPVGPVAPMGILQRVVTPPPAVRSEERRSDFEEAPRPGSTDETRRKHLRFARLLFSFGIPDTRTCQSPDEVLEKWRYFLHDPILYLKNTPVKMLLDEALDLEEACRKRLRRGTSSTRSVSMKRSLLGGNRGSWHLTDAQCRRLLNRVELFRALRSQILVLAPRKLVEVMTQVRQVLSPDSIRNKPTWWSSPRHDILLLQGVECYGLDDYLADVWKLPLFALSNPSKMFPNTAWVENFVSMLVVKARQTLRNAKARDSPEDAARRQALRRAQDIRGMRQEDPLFNVNVHAWRVDLRRADRAKVLRMAEQKPKMTGLQVNGASLLASPVSLSPESPSRLDGHGDKPSRISPEEAHSAVLEMWRMRVEDPHFDRDVAIRRSNESESWRQQQKPQHQEAENAKRRQQDEEAHRTEGTKEQGKRLAIDQQSRKQQEVEDSRNHQREDEAQGPQQVIVEQPRQQEAEQRRQKQQIVEERRASPLKTPPAAAPAPARKPATDSAPSSRSPSAASSASSSRSGAAIIKQVRTNDENAPQIRSISSSKLRQSKLNVSSMRSPPAVTAMATATAATAAATAAVVSTTLSTSTLTKRKRMPIPVHEVIVIEDSSDDDEESMRRTRSRRRL